MTQPPAHMQNVKRSLPPFDSPAFARLVTLGRVMGETFERYCLSALLLSEERKLGRIDARNDSQVIFYDQVIPGSQLMAYVNADHWALAVPIARSHAPDG
mgnify:CR=1 FL=1